MKTITRIDKTVAVQARHGTPSGTNIKVTCPACNHNTMYYNPENGGYICFRAKCGTKGFTKKRINSSVTSEKDPLLDQILSGTMQKVHPGSGLMPDEYLEYFSSSVYWIPRMRRCAFSIFNPDREHKGFQLRSYEGVEPKCINAYEGLGIHFPWRTDRSKLETDRLVLVEDIPSAEKLSTIVPTAALLGTNLTNDVLTYLYTFGVRKITIALDADASYKAAAMSKCIGFMDTAVRVLKQDPKDTSIQELKEIFL